MEFMFFLKSVTSTLIVLMCAAILWFMSNTKNENRSTYVGFWLMIGIYALSLWCMWG